MTCGKEFFIDCDFNAQRYMVKFSRQLSAAITSCCSLVMHSPILQRSVHNSWKLKTHNDDRCYSFDSGDTGVTEDGG